MNEPPASHDLQFLSDDEVPETLLPILERMMREQIPVLADTVRLLRERLAMKPDERIPRAIGTHDFELEGQRGRRIVRPYSLWMMQRARDAYRNLSSTDREAANRLLRAVKGEGFMSFDDPPRLERDGMSVRCI